MSRCPKAPRIGTSFLFSFPLPISSCHWYFHKKKLRPLRLRTTITPVFSLLDPDLLNKYPLTDSSTSLTLTPKTFKTHLPGYRLNEASRSTTISGGVYHPQVVSTRSPVCHGSHLTPPYKSDSALFSTRKSSSHFRDSHDRRHGDRTS